LLLILVLAATLARVAVTVAGGSDLKMAPTLGIPFGIVCGAIMVPWCGALVLAMMGDLMVRQEEARRGGTGKPDGTGTGPAA
jgi:TRAP-type C4-dicarboxylate transport system permease small subunit